MVNQTPYSEVLETVNRLADINASLQEHARRFCGTALKGNDWQALQQLLVARNNALLWLAARDMYLDVGTNVWRASRPAG